MKKSVIFMLIYAIHGYVAGQEVVCRKNGKLGTCAKFQNCKSAAISLMKGEIIEKCGYQGLICCYDNPTNDIETITTTERPTSTYDEDTSGEDSTQDIWCPPSPSNWTAPKNGRKAWEKCLEYHDRLVNPCQRVPMMSDMVRVRKCHHAAGKMIIGGINALPYEFPHMVLLGYNRRSEPNNRNISRIQWLCGGSLISERYVLTAGHCLSDNNIRSVKYVYVGGYERFKTSDPAKIFFVKRRIKYPSYKPPSKYDDIALLELDRDVPLDEFTVPACLYVGDKIDDSTATATGWGMTEYLGGLSNKLQKVILNKFSNAECYAQFPPDTKMKYGFDEDTQLCYGDKKKSKDTCTGDSGGPLQINSPKIDCMYVIVGVTSFGRSCGFVGEAGVYTRVLPYVSWIENIVWP